MSKSKGNLVNPSEIYNKYGSDVLRLYILFIGPADSMVDWTDSGVEGASRFLKRFWNIMIENRELLNGLDLGDLASCDNEKKLKQLFSNGRLADIEKELLRKLHQTINKVTSDILNRFNFNTAISSMMELINMMYRYSDEIPRESRDPRVIFELCRKTLLLLSPLAPFITEELWEMFGGQGSVHLVDWPDYDQDIVHEESITVIFQVNGKLRDKIDVTPGTGTDELICLPWLQKK